MRRASARALVVIIVCALPASAQWPTQITKGIPRTPDGRPDLSAPPPLTADGKPDLSGVWLPDPGAKATTGIGPTERSPYFFDITAGMKPEDIPFRQWAEAEYRRRRERDSKDDPTAQRQPTGIPSLNTYPLPFKILQLPELMVILV